MRNRLVTKVLISGLLLTAFGCSTPTQATDRVNPLPSEENSQTSISQTFKSMQEQYKAGGTDSPNISSTQISTAVTTHSSVPLSILDTNKESKILFDTSKNPLGKQDKDTIKSLESLTKTLATYKLNPVFGSLADQPLEEFDTIAIVSPSQDYSSDEINKLENFVKSGKKVVIMGEWGGSSSFASTSVNQFLAEANLQINQDLVKENNEANYQVNTQDILVSSFENHPVTSNLHTIALFSSASVEVLDGSNSNAKIVASGSNSSFRVKSTDSDSGVIAVSSIGSGKVVVIGDTSLFSTQNLEQVDNKQLALNIFSW